MTNNTPKSAPKGHELGTGEWIVYRLQSLYDRNIGPVRGTHADVTVAYTEKQRTLDRSTTHGAIFVIDGNKDGRWFDPDSDKDFTVSTGRKKSIINNKLGERHLSPAQVKQLESLAKRITADGIITVEEADEATRTVQAIYNAIPAKPGHQV